MPRKQPHPRALLAIGLLGFAVLASCAHAHAAGGEARWSTLPDALAAAQQDERLVLVYVHAPWCGLCVRMERDVFPAAQPLMDRFALARLDFDDHQTHLEVGGRLQSPFDLARDYGVIAPPTLLILHGDGSLLTRIDGYVDAEVLPLLLAYASTGAYRHASFEAYLRETRPAVLTDPPSDAVFSESLSN